MVSASESFPENLEFSDSAFSSGEKGRNIWVVGKGKNPHKLGGEPVGASGLTSIVCNYVLTDFDKFIWLCYAVSATLWNFGYEKPRQQNYII